MPKGATSIYTYHPVSGQYIRSDVSPAGTGGAVYDAVKSIPQPTPTIGLGVVLVAIGVIGTVSWWLHKPGSASEWEKAKSRRAVH